MLGRQLRPGPGEVRMRLYGQGLGDCFLLAFARDDKPNDPCYLVIDCGVAASTPRGGDRIRRVVEDIYDATGGHVDALAITHQHFDHISGFEDAWQQWLRIKVDRLYLPWTERDAVKGEHKSQDAFRKVLDQAARRVLERAATGGILAAWPGLRAEASFLGLDLSGDAVGAWTRRPRNMDEAMAFARTLCPPDEIMFLEPGDVLRLPGTEFHCYVLGPPLPNNIHPKDGKRYIELLADHRDDKVMYSHGPLGMAVDQGKPGGANALSLSDDRGLPALAAGVLAADAPADARAREYDEVYSPFAPDIRLDWDEAMASSFFQEHYGGDTPKGERGAWRRVDHDWLNAGAALALRAGDYTNNISLVLAFDVANSRKMLLFPGDAQVGNWLSWHTITRWNYLNTPPPKDPPAANPDGSRTLMQDLLSRVVFYKVSHHGSHNATVREGGLEAMTHPDLFAFVPVDVAVAQDSMGYCPMPFYPVVRALQARTGGRVFLPNGRAIAPLPDGETDAKLRNSCNITLSTEADPTLEWGPDAPLYLEVIV